MRLSQHVVPTVFACIASILFSSQALGQFSQQGPKLVGTGAVGNAFQGVAVCVSADGNTAIFGGQGDSSNAGAAWVWTRSGGVWTQQAKLVGSGAVGNTQQGTSVSLSADGNTAIVGGSGDASSVGAAWVWTRTAGVWTQQGTKLLGTGLVGTTGQGFSVSLSSDGNTAIVGAPGDTTQAGAALIWTRTAGVWTQQGTKLVGSGGAANAGQGWAVALSADGNTALVGGPNDNSSNGATWVWTRSAGVWSQQGTKLLGVGGGPSLQGTSVALSGDSNTAIVGGPGADSSVGAAWVWTRTAGVWTQQGSRLSGSGVVGNPEEGEAVALSSDGNTALIGGNLDNSSAGATWVWTRTAGTWTQQGTKLVGSGAVGSSQQGISVSLSADGKTAVIGGPIDNSPTGAAWVFGVLPADLSITKSVNGGLFPAGGNLNYTISVVNNGSGSASGVVVTDVLPAGSTFVSATPSQGSCSGTTTVSCTLGALANGGSATINLVLITSSTPGTVANTATVSATQVDPNPANNSSTSTVTTVNPALLPAASAWTLIALVGMLAVLGIMRTRN